VGRCRSNDAENYLLVRIIIIPPALDRGRDASGYLVVAIILISFRVRGLQMSKFFYADKTLEPLPT